LPGIDQKNAEVNVANGGSAIKGEKKEETEEKEEGLPSAAMARSSAISASPMGSMPTRSRPRSRTAF
jgi:hypothetical protein